MPRAKDSTRRTVSSLLAAAQTARPTTPADLQPTELGLEFLRLLPSLAEGAVSRGDLMDIPGHPEYDAAKVEAAQDRLDDAQECVWEIENAIHAGVAADPVKHIVDFAIASRWSAESRDEDDLSSTFIASVLAAAGIPESACSMEALDREARIGDD